MVVRARGGEGQRRSSGQLIHLAAVVLSSHQRVVFTQASTAEMKQAWLDVLRCGATFMCSCQALFLEVGVWCARLLVPMLARI